MKLTALPFKRSPKGKAASVLTALSHFDKFPFRESFLELAARFEAQSESDTNLVGRVDLHHSIILKPYISKEEKGIVLVSFEKELEKVISSRNFPEFDKRYQIIFLPSWTGLFSSPLIRLASKASGRFFIMPVHASERGKGEAVSEFCTVLPFNAASWINEDFYSGSSAARNIDCIIVANFARFKRHWLLFSAMSKLPEDLRIVCVGVPLGQRSSESIRAEAIEYGISSQVEIVENPPQEELRQYFARAKVFCAMSYREGSFIAVAEALISGTPVIMFKNAKVGTKELITPETGALVNSVSELRSRVIELAQGADYEAISDYAKSRVGSRVNCTKLNNHLKGASLQDGAQWTSDIEYFYSMRLKFHYHDCGVLSRFEKDFKWLRSLGYHIN